ncbi:9680_t:CDS:2, partial [Ambispora leptoticha]
IDIKHNSDPSARDTTFNEILANRDARFLTELTDYRAKFNAELHAMKTLQRSEINQRYAMVLRTEEIEFDQQSVMSQASNHSAGQTSNYSAGQASNYSAGQTSNHSSASSGQLTFTGISLTVWGQFKQIFDRIKTENNYTLEEMCFSVAMDIRSLGGILR